jgi:hypothetical protein
LAGNAADLRVGASRAADAQGNGPVVNTIVVDTPVPEVRIERAGSHVLIASPVDGSTHKTETVTLTFSKQPQAKAVGATFALSEILSVVGGSFGDWTRTELSGGAVQYQATFTPAGGRDTPATVEIQADTFRDSTGNLNAAASNLLTLQVDTLVPADPSITLRFDTFLESAKNGNATD